MADVFISYKRERRPAARHFEQILIRYGYSVWFDLALVRGKDYEAQIERELTAAKAVIVLWCGLSVASEGVRSEASRAKADGKLIPLLIEPCKLPLFSTLEQNIDLTSATGSPRDPAFDDVLDDLERLVGRAPQPDFKALRDYEATWRSMGALSFARFPLEQSMAPEAVLGDGAAEASPAAPGPMHDYAFWGREWEKLRAGNDLVALRAMVAEAPRYFADPARTRIAEIEAAQRREAEAEDRVHGRARQAEEWVRRHLEAEERERRAREAASRYSAEGRVKADARFVHGAPENWFKPGAGKTEWFKDLDVGPEMVVVPAGEFTMGSNDHDREKPPHRVTIKAPFVVGRFVVTFAEWDAAGLAHQPSDQGWGRGRRPVINVSWEDANAYAAWLSQTTGKDYRLLSEAEWEYCCRAGTTTRYAFGDSIATSQAQFSGGSVGSAGRTAEVGTFPPNAWGLYDMHGNVWEWCADDWHGDYEGAPQDGSAWAGGTDAKPMEVRDSTRDLTQEIALLLAQSIAQGQAAKGAPSAGPTGSELAKLAALISTSQSQRNLQPSFRDGLSSLSYSGTAQHAPQPPAQVVVPGPSTAGGEGLLIAEPHDEEPMGGDLSLRVLRGGAWGNSVNPGVLRSASRGRYQPAIRRNFVGFRVARPL